MPTELGYVTIAVASVPRAVAFFSGLFGWTCVESGPDAAHVSNTQLPLGLSKGGPTDYRGLYFRTPDLKASIETLVGLGGVAGEIVESPSGLSAVCGDDQGTVFSLWQPAPGFEA
jgi:predicted enzyme related to lactoylglutathione lyase